VTIDGTSILKDEGWREVKLGAVFHFWEVSGEVKAREISYRAGLWKAEEMWEALSLETRRRGIDTIYEDVDVVFGGRCCLDMESCTNPLSLCDTDC
jgi:hypothetical protein